MTTTSIPATVGTDLQDTLVELTDLHLQAKQLHWNVKGRHFRNVHLHLDELTSIAREAADTVAERAVTIGFPPDARAMTVAKNSPLPDAVEGRITDAAAVDHVVALLTVITDRLRERIVRIADMDPVSQDMLIGVATDLEKQLWMFSAQQG
ncbi:starvation-inducible DNA-binding protein [Pseudonocardia thermophila]|jgi:DNA-binding ferritin-like protein (oxidative damage protectant)|uniref:Starvation-inducible DNA-binding protein n=1 Tax=Pseudonocardia thermophila TaxID=1848 RepID=A0A1M6Q0D0_PSETH|nr:DNA starvation/stationary phase protection protein [Pseudonocardia thermophila]SHK13695.1 starvation-inducible DNA-binding protein [Pseudonocardia thermophila]